MRMTAPIRPSSTAVMLLFADVAETHWCGENQLSSVLGHMNVYIYTYMHMHA